MPSELRHILFRPPEVLQAVKEYHRRLGHKLPSGAVIGCVPEGSEAAKDVRFRITLTPDCETANALADHDQASRQDVIIEGAALAAALILYCRDRRIPMPASAGKSLQRIGQQICLVSTINPKQDEMPNAGPLRL